MVVFQIGENAYPTSVTMITILSLTSHTTSTLIAVMHLHITLIKQVAFSTHIISEQQTTIRTTLNHWLDGVTAQALDSGAVVVVDSV